MRTVALLCAAIALLGAAPDDTPTAAPAATAAPQTAVAAPPASAAAASSDVPRDAFEVGTGSDHLTGTYLPWSDTYTLATQHGGRGRPSFFEQYDEGNRYGLHDRSYGAGAYAYAGPSTIVGLELATSPTHEVDPSFAGTMSVEERFAAGYGATIGMTRRTYTTTAASIESVGADRYVGRYRVSYTATFAQLTGAPGTALTQSAGVSYYDGRGGDIGLRAYAGRDVESTGNSVLVMRVSGAALGGHLRIAPGSFLVYGLETVDQGGLYSGVGGKLGVSRRF
jgi:YaiO family outer membrane protein